MDIETNFIPIIIFYKYFCYWQLSIYQSVILIYIFLNLTFKYSINIYKYILNFMIIHRYKYFSRFFHISFFSTNIFISLYFFRKIFYFSNSIPCQYPHNKFLSFHKYSYIFFFTWNNILLFFKFFHENDIRINLLS